MPALLTEIAALHSATAALLLTPLSLQQQPFARHLHHSAERLATVTAGLPPAPAAHGDILPVIAADVRTPATALLGYARLLRQCPASFDHAALTASQSALLLTIETAAAAVLQYLEATTAAAFAARHTQRRQPPQPLDLAALLRPRLPVYGYWLKQRPLRLVAQLPDGLPPAFGSAYHVSAWVDHVVLTMGRELMEYGELHLLARPRGGWLEVGIFGSGCRLDDDEMQRLFGQPGQALYWNARHSVQFSQVVALPGSGATLYGRLPRHSNI
ncbi:MAG: hypothetical protein MUE40_20320 [Anaerolineae bacterium]|nr:hypothetical protein [Anaerolineae bacterium]